MNQIGAGVFASSQNFYAICGYNYSNNGTAIFGQANKDSGNGVFGLGNTANCTGVYGACNSVGGFGAEGTTTFGVGMYGYSAGAGTGMYGYSTGGTGVYGVTNATNKYGILGTTTAANSTAIAGSCTQNGSSAFSGGTTNPNAFAAFFQGTVVVQGSFAVTGTKSAVIQYPRTGDHRLVYCVESPESWFEDFGEATLTGGKADVKPDPDFAALIHADTYHVFLTTYGAESNGLNVTERTANGFTVQERNKGIGNGRFSWRVVAKRADVEGERLGAFTMSTMQLAQPPKAMTSPPAPQPMKQP